MSVSYDLDYTYYEWYLQECRALEVAPSISDYQVFLQDMDIDRKEMYDSGDNDEDY